MCFSSLLGSSKSVNTNSKASKEAKDEKEKAAAKARLLETQGENRGEELASEKGKNVRKVFGN